MPPLTRAVGEFRALPHETRVGLTTLVQRMEMVGMLAADRVIDLDLVEKSLGSFVVLAWTKLAPGLAGLRRDSGDAQVAEYFQWLAERVEERLRASAATPAYERLRAWKP